MIKIPIFEYRCKKCGRIIERLEMPSDDFSLPLCNKCKIEMYRKISLPTFKLTYDPKKDICDWQGNTTQYYNEYRKQKEEGKDVRIPQIDGE